MITYASFDHSYLVILLNFWWPKSPLIARPSPHHRLNQLAPRTTQKDQACVFKLRCPQEIQPTFILATRGVEPTSPPLGMTPLKNCAKAAHLSLFADWGNCPSLSPSKNYIAFKVTPSNSPLAAHLKKCIVFMSTLYATQQSVHIRNYAGMISRLTSQH